MTQIVSEYALEVVLRTNFDAAVVKPDHNIMEAREHVGHRNYVVCGNERML